TKRLCVGVKIDEHQTVHELERSWSEAELLEPHTVSVIVKARSVLESPSEAKAPPVIRADKAFLLSGRSVAEQRTAVSADVEEGIDLVGPRANHDDAFVADTPENVVTNVRELRYVTGVEPAPGDQQLHLALEDFRRYVLLARQACWRVLGAWRAG